MHDAAHLEATVAEFFRASADRDWDGWRAVMAPSAILRQNFARGRDISVEDGIAWARRLAESGVVVSYSNERRLSIGNVVVEQHDVTLTRGDVSATGEVCLVFTFDDEGKATLVEEYADSAGFASVLG